MTDIKKSNQSSVGVNPVVAAVAGAVIGGAAVASAMIISNKDNQAKVKAVVSDVRDDLNHRKASIAAKADKLGNITKNAVKDVKNI